MAPIELLIRLGVSLIVIVAAVYFWGLRKQKITKADKKIKRGGKTWG